MPGLCEVLDDGGGSVSGQMGTRTDPKKLREIVYVFLGVGMPAAVSEIKKASVYDGSLWDMVEQMGFEPTAPTLRT